MTIDPAYGLTAADAAPVIAAAEAMTVQNVVETAAALVGLVEGPHTPDFFRSWHRRRLLSMPPHVLVESFVRIWTGRHPLGLRTETEPFLEKRACPSMTVFSAGHDDSAAWATARSRPGLDETLYLPLGHWPHHESPGLFSTLIESWAARLGGRRSP